MSFRRARLFISASAMFAGKIQYIREKTSSETAIHRVMAEKVPYLL